MNTKFRNKLKCILIVFSVLSLVLLIDSTNLFNFKSNNYEFDDKSLEEKYFNNNLKNSNGNSILFEGTEQPLIINDTGLLNDFNQEITASNQGETNLSYYLDDVHSWKVSKIQTSINNIQDTREWVNNSDFLPITTFSKNVSGKESSHDYQPNRGRVQTLDSITADLGTIAMRVHFTRFEFEDSWDYFLMENENNTLIYVETGNKTDFYSPWIWGSELNFYYESDGSIEFWGYKIDHYEFINESSDFYINSNSWEFNNISSTRTNYGAGSVGGADSMFVALYSEISPDLPQYDAVYYEGDFMELYQNITIPRGAVIDAYISFDYYAEFAMDSNENFIYCEINNKKIYSKGIGDIADAGRQTWHNTGKINMDLWLNTSDIFGDIQNNNEFNISIGIMSGASITYSGFEDQFQQIFWFDNVSLELTTLANSTQSDINLTLNSEILSDGNQWGHSSRNFTGKWEDNPVIITVETASPNLNFELDTVLYGYHNTTTKIEQTVQEGVGYKILENGSVYWEFTHNFFMPSQYEDFEFTITKPINWEITSVFDPTLQSVSYEGGSKGEIYLTINTTYAIFPGWWSFVATSPNYLNSSNTKMLKQGEWVGSSFITGESTRIRTQINNSNEIPPNVNLTMANLTIYDPTGSIWYEESVNPLSNGTVLFSEITFTALNSIGGQYNYSIFWSNGTAIGGVKSDFIVNHQTSLTLLKPDDAQLDLRTEGFVGDIIPVRILLKDVENNFTIPDAIVSYNWSDGTRYFTDSGLGIYETTLFTGDLVSRGLHNIIINSTKVGFITSNITLEINLGEETNIQVLESEYNIELHANSTIKFKFSDYNGTGIDGALVNVSISNNSFYSIASLGGGIYDVEFSTLYIDEIGIYQIHVNFSAVAYEPQYYTHQFTIIKQSVNLSVYVNSQQIDENDLKETAFNEEANISVRALSSIDNEYLTGGVITFISGSYQKNLTMNPDYWYNTTITFSPVNFSLLINLAYLQFEHPNYKTATFGFQFLIDQIEIGVDPISFEDTINAEIGETINIQIQLIDNKTSNPIEDATIKYIWEYGIGTINQTVPGTYEADIKLPDGVEGNFKVDLIITPNNSIYKSRIYSFFLVIGEPVVEGGSEFPSLLLWIIIGILVSIVSVLGFLSMRTYVLLPRRRKKEAELLMKTQRFKDLRNIQAIVIVHKLSGIPLYSKSYSILEKHKKELFSGFIQAITTVGEEFTEREDTTVESEDSSKNYGVEKIIELDFKYFYCLIADKDDVRAVFILREKSSERLKSQVSNLILALNLKLSVELENWDGSLDKFEVLVPTIINEYFELHYKGSFELSERIDLLKLRKEKALDRLEIRTLNVIQSAAKRNNNVVNLDNVIELVSEENKDLIIVAIETLIEKKYIFPINP
jgi:hypothetical protein